MNPMTVSLYDVNCARVTTQLLDMCLTSGIVLHKIYTFWLATHGMFNYAPFTQYVQHRGPRCGTAEAIFAKMNEVLQSNHISWTNCVGVSVDNTSVNTGKSNSIMTRVKQQNPAAYFMGCPCHILHNMATKASKSFALVSHITINSYNCLTYNLDY